MKSYRLLVLFFVLINLFSCSKKDKDFPVISLKGDAVIIIPLNSAFSDPGAEAFDETEGSIPVDISGDIDVNFAGTYYIIYSASDAAGNTGMGTRTVIVRNEAEIFNGFYAVKSVVGSDTTDLNANIVTSNTINFRLWLSGFSIYENAPVFVNIVQDSVFVPEQLSEAGIPLIPHSFSGKGVVKEINDKKVLEINFSDSVSGNIIDGIIVYTRQ